MFELIYEWIPHRYRIRDLELIFKLSEHGINFNIFYNRVGEHSPVLLLIKTVKNMTFGAYIPCHLKVSNEMIGSGETFLFSITPSPQKYSYNPEAKEFFIKAEKNSLRIGFGGEGVGIYISEEWIGSSARCSTFNNPPFNGEDDDNFMITEAEVYVFV